MFYIVEAKENKQQIVCVFLQIYLYMNNNIYPECHSLLMDTDMVFEMICLCSELVQKLFVILIAIKIQIFNRLRVFCYFLRDAMRV